MKTIFQLALLAALLLISPAAWAQKSGESNAKKAADPARFEKEIAAYEAEDRTSPPPKGGLLFTGSSTIRRWTTLAKDFPEHQVINRGFGGSTISECTHFADRIVLPYSPKAVYLRAGGNDLNAGKSVEQVFGDYKDFVAKIHGKLPDCDIYFISLSPSISRWKQADKEKELNNLIQTHIAGKPHLKYIETYDMVLGTDGQPRPELFVADKLHFSPEGYKLLIDKVRPYLAK